MMPTYVYVRHVHITCIYVMSTVPNHVLQRPTAFALESRAHFCTYLSKSAHDCRTNSQVGCSVGIHTKSATMKDLVFNHEMDQQATRWTSRPRDGPAGHEMDQQATRWTSRPQDGPAGHEMDQQATRWTSRPRDGPAGHKMDQQAGVDNNYITAIFAAIITCCFNNTRL